LIFSVGLIFRVAYPALIAHGAIAFPDGRLRAPIPLSVVAAAYLVNIVVLGVVPTLFFDPGSARCPSCPDNIFAFGSNIDVVASATRLGLVLEAAWIAAAIGLMIDRLAKATAASRWLIAPVMLPAVALLAFVAMDALHAVPRGNLSNDPIDLGLWYGEAAAIMAMAAGVELEGFRARRARHQVSQIVLDLTGAPPAGQLRDRLAMTLGDPALGLAYAVGGGRFADVHGRLVDVVPDKGRTATRIERGTALVGMLLHRTDLLDDPERLDESIAAARLAIENERLHAETQVQLEDLRASRVRIIDTADRERRRLERDLHDGAQQRLVHLSMAVGLARLRLGVDDDTADATRLAEVDVELRGALSDLRELAHGIYPTELADGLAAGIAVLAEEAPILLQIVAMPDTRFDPRVEATAYFLIAQSTLGAGVTKATVRVDRLEDRLVIDVEVDGPLPASMVGLEDRVGALDGTITTRASSADRYGIHAEIPCAS
jgi:signal transduction histidine kinase